MCSTCAHACAPRCAIICRATCNCHLCPTLWLLLYVAGLPANIKWLLIRTSFAICKHGNRGFMLYLYTVCSNIRAEYKSSGPAQPFGRFEREVTSGLKHVHLATRFSVSFILTAQDRLYRWYSLPVLDIPGAATLLTNIPTRTERKTHLSGTTC